MLLVNNFTHQLVVTMPSKKGEMTAYCIAQFYAVDDAKAAARAAYLTKKFVEDMKATGGPAVTKKMVHLRAIPKGK